MARSKDSIKAIRVDNGRYFHVSRPHLSELFQPADGTREILAIGIRDPEPVEEFDKNI